MTHINQRRDFAATWLGVNPVLQEGEVGWEIDTRRGKVGDGVTAWADLSYIEAAVSGNASDIGLGNVDNTSDLDKPVSVATQVALDLKADIDSPVFTGSPQAPKPAVDTNSDILATTSFVRDYLHANPTVIPVSNTLDRDARVVAESWIPGQLVYRDDTDRIEVWTGTVWRIYDPVITASATLATIARVTAGTVKWRARNGINTIDISALNFSTALAINETLKIVTAGTIPAVYRPTDSTYAGGWAGSNDGWCRVNSDGTVDIHANGVAMTSFSGTLNWVMP
jgi:hypothetical protein